MENLLKTHKPNHFLRPPKWIKRSDRLSNEVITLQKKLNQSRLVTVCEEARCPNIQECFSKPTATFMVLGKTCTRHCSFCSIEGSTPTTRPLPPNPNEPELLSHSVLELRLKYVVITMVARDDLPDGGASHLSRCIQAVQASNPNARIEVLTSDFEGNRASVETVVATTPNVFNHNLETVKRLQLQIRHKATYERSLQVLEWVKEINPEIRTKSGVMVGLGETKEEVLETLKDLKKSNCDYVTIGQYLPPGKNFATLKEYIHPEVFSFYREFGVDLGFKGVFSGPNVRSSYMADHQTLSD